MYEINDDEITIYFNTAHGPRPGALWWGTDVAEALRVVEIMRQYDPWSPTVIVRDKDGAIYRDGQWTEA